jgi:hypothetical protein
MHDLQGLESAMSDVSRLKRVLLLMQIFFCENMIVLSRNSKELMKAQNMKFPL